MPRIAGAPKSDQMAGKWWNLLDVVFQIVGGSQQPQPPAIGLPLVVEIDQNGDQFCFTVGMDFPVTQSRTSADGQRGGTVRQIHVEFIFECLAHGVATQLVDQFSERSATREMIQWKTARLVNLRKVFADRIQKLLLHKPWYDEIVERVGR